MLTRPTRTHVAGPTSDHSAPDHPAPNHPASGHSAPDHSATLAIDEAVAARRRAGQQILHLGFGEAGLPVLPELIDALTGAADRNAYGPVAGTEELRAAAASWFTRRDVATGPEQIIVAPGSKPLLFALLAAIDGDIVLPRPAWVSYAAQAALLGRRVLTVPIGAGAGGVPDPDQLASALHDASSAGARPGVLVLTIPDNPTGTVATADAVRQVCAIAHQHGLAIICDEIYAPLCHHGNAPSAAHHLPERTIVTSGLSKSLALGGWRIGYARVPDNTWGAQLRARLTGIASELWSSLAAPMQAVATYALDDPPEVTDHIATSRHLHARVATAAHAQLTALGVACRPPTAGFYLYPDLTPHADNLAARGITTSTALATALLDEHGIATLPGRAFGEPDTTLTLRIATSLLYGDTPQQRWTALAASEPETLPWVAGNLTRLGAGLHALLH